MRNIISKFFFTLLALTIGIGSAWGADYNLINGNDDASTATLNTVDFWTAQTLQTKSNGGDDYKKCIITAGTVSAGASNLASPTKHIQYDVKTTATTLTIKVYNTNSGDLNITINEVKEAANGAITASNTNKSVTKGSSGGLQTITYSTTNTAGTKSSIYIAVPSSAGKIEFYQITASETGSALTNLKGGRAGYSLDFTKKARLAAKGGEISMLDSVEYKPSGDFKPNSTTYLQLKTTNYVKFKTLEPILLTVDANNAYQFYVAKTLDGTTYGANTKAVHKFKLTTADTWYIIGGASSANQINKMSFSPLYTITYYAGTGSGSMDVEYGYEDEEITVSACTFDPPAANYDFAGWTVTGVGGTTSLVDEGSFTMPDNAVTLTANWVAGTTKYAITKGDHDNGDFTISPATQEEGETVTLSATPDFRYLFGAWEVVKTEDGSATGITVDANGQFTMPAYAVTVNATFNADTRKQILYLTTAATTNDKMYAALNAVGDYNVIVEEPSSQTLTNYDLVVLHESIAGNAADPTKGDKKPVILNIPTTTIPVLNTKSYFYTSARWNWGAAANGKKTKGMHVNTSYCNITNHPLFNDLTPDENDSIIILSSINSDNKPMQPVTSFTSGKEGYTLANVPDGCAIHELTPTQRGVASGKYLLISVYNKDLNNLNANGQKLFQNAAAYLIGSTAWTPGTVPSSASIAASPSAVYEVGDDISLSASATGTDASTTYTWYKGADLATAISAGAIKATATAAAGGNAYSKEDCVAEDAGLYWCVISNGGSCEASTSLSVTVSSTPIVSYDITFVSAHGTAPTATTGASVVLTELSESGWAHKGWTADVDVTVDAATVTAGTLIENGKTAILASNVTFTAVWKEIFEVSFNLNGYGDSPIAPQDIEDGAKVTKPADPSETGHVFAGWYKETGCTHAWDFANDVVAENTELFAKWVLDIQLSEIVFSNNFKGWINGSTITVFYMEGESAPTITSYSGTNLKAADAVVISGDKVIATGSDDSEKEYDLTMTAVTPLTTTGAKQTFDGTETYVKSAYGWKWHETDASKQKGWAFQKVANDGRVAKGLTREYFFFGPAESATFTWKVAKKNSSDPAVAYVYVDGVLANTVTSTSTSDPVVVNLKNANSIVAFESAQTNGDCGLMDVTLAPWVPTTAVVLKEGGVAISEKEIWASTNFTLTAEVTPDNASDKTITWTSSNDAVATVADGVVTGVAANASPVTITATTVDGVYATCEVTVTTAPTPCETPTITTQPASQAYCTGSEPTLTVEANVTDGGTLHYAWTKDDVAIGGDAATCLVDGAGTYKVVVTNHVDGKLDANVTSNEAVITLNVAAAITTQPTNKRDIVSGADVTLSVVATNATGYQWYSCDDAEKHNAAAIPGEDEADYTFACTADGYYYCVVGNACGEDLASNVVSVKLEPTGCNLIGTATDNSYTKTGEWSVYPVNSNGVHSPTDENFGTCKAFDNTTDVNCINTRRFAINFEKDVESVTIYARGGTGRTFTSVSVSSEMTKNTYTELTDIDKQITTIDGAGNQYVITAEGIIPGGQYAWFEFSGSFSGVFKICYTEAAAKCEAPVLPALANKELCEGDAFTAWNATATVSDGGSLSYQWYNGDTDEALDGETNATFTPTADGNYYVIVTNTLAAHRNNSTKSAVLNVTHFASASITTAPVNIRKDVGYNGTLTVEAAGKAPLNYTWYTCNEDGTGAVAIPGESGPAKTSLAVTVAAGVQYYKVVVESTCGNAEAVAKVEEWVELSQVDVTTSTVWDWDNAVLTSEQSSVPSAGAIITGETGTYVVLANVDHIYYGEEFNSRALVGLVGQNAWRSSSYKAFQGAGAGMLKFHPTVAGVVRVLVSSSNGNTDTEITIGNSYSKVFQTANAGRGKAIYTDWVEVPADADVVIGTGTAQSMRIYRIEFYALDQTRDDAWIAPGELGTICYPNGHVVVGAEMYQMKGTDENGKFVFDEVTVTEPGVPYLFRATSSDPIKFYKTLAAAAVEAGTSHGMVGTFVEIIIPQASPNKYYFSGTKFYAVTARTTDLTVPANRAYVDLTTPHPAAAPKQGVRRIVFDVQGGNSATGIDELNASEKPVKIMIDGTMYILRGEKMYDATGRLVK